MSIDDDAVAVLAHLAQYEKVPGDPEKGHYTWEGDALRELTGLSPRRLNDAVSVLEEDGHAELVRAMGTDPYDFAEVSLTTRGRRAAEKKRHEEIAASTIAAAPADNKRFSFGTMLGEGTYGEVWRASDHELKRDVAIKFIVAIGQQDALAHARALARVTHPNIVAVYDVSSLTHPVRGDSEQAVVMELVNGTPLVQLIGPTMLRGDVERIALAILGALAAYHSAGLAHLDMHDGNVMVGDGGVVKVLDPLYYETAWFRSTATREQQQARDVRQLRDVLQQMVHAAVTPEVANEFDRATSRPTLAVLGAGLERALRSDSSAPQRSSSNPQDLDRPSFGRSDAQLAELRSAYAAWFLAARAWLNTMFGFGLQLDASVTPLEAHKNVDPDERRRLEAATLSVQFLDGNSERNSQVDQLSAVIGMGGPTPKTPEQHRAFGRRCIAVSADRLKVLENFQRTIATWLSNGAP